MVATTIVSVISSSNSCGSGEGRLEGVGFAVSMADDRLIGDGGLLVGLGSSIYGFITVDRKLWGPLSPNTTYFSPLISISFYGLVYPFFSLYTSTGKPISKSVVCVMIGPLRVARAWAILCSV